MLVAHNIAAIELEPQVLCGPLGELQLGFPTPPWFVTTATEISVRFEHPDSLGATGKQDDAAV